MNQPNLLPGELDSIKSVVQIHRATENAIFSLAVQTQELKSLRKTADKMLLELEVPETDTPQVSGARAVSATFKATLAHTETLHKQVERITDSQSNQGIAITEAGGPEKVKLFTEMAQELAKEFAATLTVNPNMKGGKPCVRGHRISAFDVLEFIACGDTTADIITKEPLLKEKDIQDCIQFGLKLAEATQRCLSNETAA